MILRRKGRMIGLAAILFTSATASAQYGRDNGPPVMVEIVPPNGRLLRPEWMPGPFLALSYLLWPGLLSRTMVSGAGLRKGRLRPQSILGGGRVAPGPMARNPSDLGAQWTFRPCSLQGLLPG